MIKPRTKNPIMSADEERFMAFEGLVQWAHTCIYLGNEIEASERQLFSEAFIFTDWRARRLTGAIDRSRHDFFVLSAHQLMEHRQWWQRLESDVRIDFSPLDQFDAGAIRDLRDMRVHVVDYFGGVGWTPSRWVVKTPEYSSDASAYIRPMIGGRLDWIMFSRAAKEFLNQLIALPPPVPPATSGAPYIPQS